MDNIEALLREILENQERFKEDFEEFKEEVFVKLDNVSTPGSDFRVIEELT